MAGVTLHPLQWVVAILLLGATHVWCAPYLKAAPGAVGGQQPPLDHLFSPDQGLIGPLFRQNDYSIDPPTMGGCYYQFRPYDEGDRIITNEPCLNCTCHNSMLMCYLKVCPFSKPIGQDCTIEKDLNQCCPVITCPQVPVGLEVVPESALTTTKSPTSTAVVPYTKHGCTIADEFYPDGAQVPGDPKNPCELCYCIRNHTACLMQECILKVEGCKPVFEDGICCPVRYMCEYDEEELLQITTTLTPILNETIITTLPPHIGGCTHDFNFYADGAQIPSTDPCEHCYCMKNDIVCAIQECRSPLDEDDENCVPRLPPPGQCCPEAYDCPTTDETTTISSEHTTYAYPPFGIKPEVETEMPTIVEDKEIIHFKPVEETTLEYVTAEIVTVTKKTVPLTTDKATVPEEAIMETTEEEKVIATDTTEAPAIEEAPAEITKSTDSDSDLLETRTTGPDDGMFLTTTPMSDETTLKPDTEAVKEVTMPTITADKEKLPEPTLKPVLISETDVEFDDVTLEPKEPASDFTTKPDEKEAVTEEIVSKDTTLAPIDSLETTSVKEELIEVSIETTTSEKLEPVDILTTKAPTLPEETTIEDIAAITDAPTKELTTEAITPDTKPEISETTTLSPEISLETTSPKEDITDISIETTTEKVEIVDVTSKATEPPVDIIDKVTTISDVEDLVEATTTSEVEPVTGVIDPKIQPTATKKPEVVPVDGKCLSNGTTYDEGDLVPIVSICQENCVCTSGVVTCQQIACPSPPPAFLRCDTQKNPKECCPQYECPMIQPDPVPSPNCINNGQQYLEGEFIPSPDSCTDCYCLYGDMICAYQECPEVEPGCKPLEIPEGSCCPSKYECPAMEILDLTLTTMPSVEISEVTTFSPKEIPDIEITTTKPKDVIDSVVATTSSQIPDELITEKPIDEQSTTIPDATKDIETVTLEVITEKEYEIATQEAVTDKEIEVTPEVVTEKEIEVVAPEVVTEKEIGVVTPEAVTEVDIAETPAEATLAPIDIKVKPESTTDVVTEAPEEQDLMTTEVEIEVEIATTESIETVKATTSDADIEFSTSTPEREITTLEMEDEVTTKLTVTTPSEIGAELETTPDEPLVKETTVKSVDPITEPTIVSGEEIHEDEELTAFVTESVDLLEPVTTAVATVSPVEVTTLEYDIETPSEDVTETTVPSKVEVLTTTELPVDVETKVSLTPDIIEETTKLDIVTTTMAEEITETSIAPKVEAVTEVEVTTAVISEIDELDLITVSKLPDGVTVTTEAIVQPEETTAHTLIDVQTDKVVELVTDPPLDLSTILEKEIIAVDEFTTTPKVDSEVVVEITTPDIPVEIVTIPASEVQTEKSTDIPVEIIATTASPEVDIDAFANITTTETPVEIVTTTTGELPTEKSTDQPIEIITTIHISPDLEETTPAVDIDTTTIPYFESCWWFDDKLYEHGESVPSDNSCQENCRCINGTVRCQYKACPPTPPTFLHCTETFNNESCCTTYECAPLPTNLQCMHQGKIYADGDYVPSETLCFDCYCVEGEVICADLVCGIPRSDCDAIMQRADECCPTSYECKEMVSPDMFTSTLAPELELTTATTATPSAVEDLIEPKIKNVTSVEPVEITPTPDIVTDEITADEETLPEIPEKVPAEVITDVQYIPPTTVFPHETTTWAPTTTTELVIGPGSCLFNGKVYVSAQQIPREDPCDFCFCFRGDIICLQQTCPPPIPGCYEEAISGFCCPRYECPVKQSVIEITTTTTPFPSFPPQYKTSRETVCEVDGIHYPVGQVIPEASSPCHECICGKDGFMKCLPKECDSHRKLSIHSYR